MSSGRAIALLALQMAASCVLHAQPRFLDDRGKSVALPRAPQRIVSLLPSLTETVCALQACDRLVGVDRYSNWPPQVRRLPRLGALEDAQIERIVALKPDLVLAAVSTRALARLESLGLPVLALEPHDLAGMRRSIVTLAQALGDAPAGPALLARIDARIELAAARVPPAWRGAAVYFEVAATPHAAGPTSFLGQLLQRLGLGNIVAPTLGAFPQLNPEFVLQAQPALVMASAQALAEMPARPGWSALQALRRHRACGFSAAQMDTLVRPGPRLGDAADAIAACLAALGAPAP